VLSVYKKEEIGGQCTAMLPSSFLCFGWMRFWHVPSLATITIWGFRADPFLGIGSFAVFAMRGARSPARRKVESTLVCKLK